MDKYFGEILCRYVYLWCVLFIHSRRTQWKPMKYLLIGPIHWLLLTEEARPHQPCFCQFALNNPSFNSEALVIMSKVHIIGVWRTIRKQWVTWQMAVIRVCVMDWGDGYAKDQLLCVILLIWKVLFCAVNYLSVVLYVPRWFSTLQFCFVAVLNKWFTPMRDLFVFHLKHEKYTLMRGNNLHYFMTC